MNLFKRRKQKLLNNIKHIIYNELESIQEEKILNPRPDTASSELQRGKWIGYFEACYDIYLMIKGRPFPQDIRKDSKSTHNDLLRYAERENHPDQLKLLHTYDNGCCANCKHWDIVESSCGHKQMQCICKINPETHHCARGDRCDDWESAGF